MHIRTNFESSFWTRKGKARGKEEIKIKRHGVAREGGKEGTRPVRNPSYLSSWPCLACKALSQELALKIRKQQAAPGETRSWLSGELEEISAHPPHTHTLPFASYLIVSLWLSLNTRSTPEHGEKAHSLLQLLHCQTFPFCLKQTPTYNLRRKWSHESIMSVQPAGADRTGKGLGSICFSD